MKVITIGRSTENNDIVVNDEKVSRNHLQMVMDDNGNYSVVDLGSTNGTFVNGQRISGEVRLQPGDEVKIGQTVLPWQNYFVSSFQPPVVNPPLSPRPPKGPNRTWLYVIIGAALLLLIGGGVVWKIYHDKQKEKIEQEEKDKEEKDRQLEQEANDARVEAARLSKEAEAAARKAEAAARKAAETKSEKDKAIADEMKAKAEEANRLAQQKEAQWMQMKADLEAANKAKEEAEGKSAEDAKAKEDAVLKAKAAQEEALQAQNAKVEAEQKAEFYRLISQVKQSLNPFKKTPFDIVIEKMEWTDMEMVYEDAKREYIIRKFEEGDQAQKQKIINAVKEALEQQKKDSNSTILENESVNENEEIPETPITDTMVIKPQDTID